MFKIKKINLLKLGRGITVDKAVIFFFLLINVGLYYNQFLFLIQVSYAVLFAGIAYKILSKRKIIHRNYLIAVCVFGFYAYLSLLWANDPELTSANVTTLAKYIAVSCLFITMLDKPQNIKFSLLMLSVSGLVYTIMYLNYWDFSALGYERASSALAESDMELPNINIVGLIASNSFVCLLFFYFHSKKRLAIVLASVAIISIFFLGSRKSIIFCLLGMLLIFFRLKGKSKFSLTLLALVFFQVLILFIPDQYFSFIWDRFSELRFFSTVSKLDYSDQLRVDFATYSIQYFNIAPIFGHGYFNFASLFNTDKGVSIYSHNNFFETAVGLGMVGIIFYYSIYYFIARNLTWTRKLDFSYLFIILLVLNLFNHFFIVVTNDRFTWLLLPIIYAGSRYLQPERQEESFGEPKNVQPLPQIQDSI